MIMLIDLYLVYWQRIIKHKDKYMGDQYLHCKIHDYRVIEIISLQIATTVYSVHNTDHNLHT